MNRVRRFFVWTTVLAVLWLAFSSVLGIVAVEGAVHPVRRTLLASDRGLAQSVAARNSVTLANVSIVADDGAILRAWLLAQPGRNLGAAILLHGQADNRTGMLGNAEMLLRHGFSVLLPDTRAHGESGGTIATYGVKESGDIRRWFDWLHQTLAPRCIYGLGDSMGAAILLQAVVAEPHFCAIVAEGSFASFREASYDRLGQFFATGPWLGRTLLQPAVEAGFVYARLKYGVDFEHASPAIAVSQTHIPILLIHGQADTNLPPRHSERIKAASAAAVLWEPADAGHCGASVSAPAEYERRVIGWFDSHTQYGLFPTGFLRSDSSELPLHPGPCEAKANPLHHRNDGLEPSPQSRCLSRPDQGSGTRGLCSASRRMQWHRLSAKVLCERVLHS